MPIVIPDIPFIGRRRKPAVMPVTTGLTLVSATWDAGSGMLVLTFDRAIDVSGMVPYQISVFDGPGGVEWGATPSVTQISPEMIEIVMIDLYAFTGEGVVMTATDATGIVAVEGGAAWAGAADLGLPYP